MSLMIAVKSCNRDLDRGCHATIRETWGAAFKGLAHVKFFVGAETDGRTARIYKSDEVVLDVPDHYEGLVFKTRGIAQYMLGKNIDHALLVDTDCCVFPEKVFKSGFQVADYAGIFNGGWGNVGPREINGKNGTTEMIERCHSWATGAGYFISRAAAFELADVFPNEGKYIVGSNEDLWVGQILGPIAAQGHLFSMQLEAPVCKYYLVDGHSKDYDPKSGWMQETWKAGQ